MSRGFEKHLSVVTVIDYYDGPLLFTAVDKVGTSFLCSHLKYLPGGSQYLAVPISKAKLDSFLASKVDLRSIYIFPETREFYLIETSSQSPELIATLIENADIPTDLLPSEGYFVTEPVINEPLAVNRALFEASLDVSEAKDIPAIDTYTCSDFLKILQDFIKYGYKKAIAPLRADIRKPISGDRCFQTELFGTAGGSFTVKLRSVTTGDLNQFVDLDRGLQKIVQVFEVATDHQKALGLLRENRGHFVGAFNRLLDLAIERQCSVGIAWRPTAFGQPAKRLKITREEATTLRSAISSQTDLSTELIEIVGEVDDVLTSHRVSWTLKADDGEFHVGIIEQGKDITLEGVVIGNRYKFYCREVLRESSVGRRHTILYLYKYEPA